ncbi:unnamed protein product [Vitrella brassicaformis CCMP3155]|uniref:Peptidase C1A papain C-terminal domain-containing protein n=1 Tax=Vitrella brassicaformis (strain CCMP3155) TaxID=1169540 RepID=A0A0G4EXL7_VITBC|nr:unnamed protein product [Vitrella brassicaformis CCMP3155]|eukprot:CEM03461.1 unnamed protein product [Vitrella brassicaformis CCMP3155]
MKAVWLVAVLIVSDSSATPLCPAILPNEGRQLAFKVLSAAFVQRCNADLPISQLEEDVDVQQRDYGCEVTARFVNGFSSTFRLSDNGQSAASLEFFDVQGDRADGPLCSRDNAQDVAATICPAAVEALEKQMQTMREDCSMSFFTSIRLQGYRVMDVRSETIQDAPQISFRALAALGGWSDELVIRLFAASSAHGIDASCEEQAEDLRLIRTLPPLCEIGAVIPDLPMPEGFHEVKEEEGVELESDGEEGTTVASNVTMTSRPPFSITASPVPQMPSDSSLDPFFTFQQKNKSYHSLIRSHRALPHPRHFYADLKNLPHGQFDSFLAQWPASQASRTNRDAGDTTHTTIVPYLDWGKVRDLSEALVREVLQSRGGKPLPDEWDFRKEVPQCVRKVRAQRECGSCWAFAALGALEKQICKRSEGRASPNLSREELVRCSANNYGCDCGNVYWAYMDLIEMEGVGTKDCVAYRAGHSGTPATGSPVGDDFCVGIDSSCGQRYTNRYARDDPEWVLLIRLYFLTHYGYEHDKDEIADYLDTFKEVFATDAVYFVHGEEAIKAAIYADLFPHVRQRIAWWSRRSTHRYAGESISCPVSVLFSGWGVDPTDTKYWIAENSYGDAWGETRDFRPCKTQACQGDFCKRAFIQRR